MFLFACSSEQKLLEKCADKNFTDYPPDNFVKKSNNPFDAIGPKNNKESLKVFLNKKLNEKMENNDYSVNFVECVNFKNTSPEIFKAKYE